jgi:hypothetical protein
VLPHGASSIEKANLVAFSHNLIGLHTQPHRITSPVEVRFAPAGKRFDIIGAVDELSPFPVANLVKGELARDHPLRGGRRDYLVAAYMAWISHAK